MKLYFSPGACSLSPHIALREAGIPVELVKVDLKTKQTANGENYLQINPKGYVPALVLDSGEVLTEGPAIVQYIADQKPETKLAPVAGTIERVRLQEWLNYITSELHKSFSGLFNPQAPTEWKTMVRDMLGKRFGFIEAHLENRSYLLGDQFTVADGYLFTILLWTRAVEIDLKQWPILHKYFERIAGRAKVQEAFHAEGIRL